MNREEEELAEWMENRWLVAEGKNESDEAGEEYLVVEKDKGSACAR